MAPLDRPRRGALYVPAANPRAIAKARTLPADVIVIDLEDAVAPEMKISARAAALAAVTEGAFGAREVVVRVNGLDTAWGARDCAAIATSGADAVLIPKVAAPADIDRYGAAIVAAPPALQLWAMVETCGAMLRLDAIAARAADTRLSGLVIGTNDLGQEMRARPTGPDRAPFTPLLALAVCAARAHGLIILDGACDDFTDLAAFRVEAEQARGLGFDGKTLIHPAQIDPCNAVFSPDAEDLARARAVIAAFALPPNAGKGAIRVAGRMVELLHRDAALRTVALAERIGMAAPDSAPDGLEIKP